jgi:integrase
LTWLRTGNAPGVVSIERRAARFAESTIAARLRAVISLAPQQIERIYEACASWDNETREWRGSVRNRLLWMLLAETGLRLGEALGVAHRDWHTGWGDTPFIEVVVRDHPHAVRAKSG